MNGWAKDQPVKETKIGTFEDAGKIGFSGLQFHSEKLIEPVIIDSGSTISL